ncbi:22131_t:CDS:2 [Racocetra persica]|uniref:22131_t:CDS:1 n=1 Tax=Racocetra persica TaxID=160502 RepID=A0ACA9LDB9_9GLOM|nr:22131_t:CDS:2 [Racocetra persica]
MFNEAINNSILMQDIYNQEGLMMQDNSLFVILSGSLQTYSEQSGLMNSDLIIDNETLDNSKQNEGTILATYDKLILHVIIYEQSDRTSKLPLSEPPLFESPLCELPLLKSPLFEPQIKLVNKDNTLEIGYEDELPSTSFAEDTIDVPLILLKELISANHYDDTYPKRISNQELTYKNIKKKKKLVKSYNIYYDSDNSKNSNSDYANESSQNYDDIENIDLSLIQNLVVYSKKDTPCKTCFKRSQELKPKTSGRKPTEC